MSSAKVSWPHKERKIRRRLSPLQAWVPVAAHVSSSPRLAELSTTLPSYRAKRNAKASTTTHPATTSAATAPAVILAFSFVL
jgi:hypothetical protein